MKQLLNQLDARMRHAAARLDAAVAVVASWSFASAPALRAVAVNAKPGSVAIHTATDVHARRPQESSP